jgi:peptidoglycan-N-acetylglucosamine deacetylase
VALAVGVFGAVVGGVLLVLAFPRVPVQMLQALWPGIVWRVDASRPVLSLTFDDGPDPRFTPQVLEILRAHDVRATFFLAGDRARRYPEVVRAICEAGHEIANHSDSWRRTSFVPLGVFEADILRAEDTLATYSCFVKLFRPAGVTIRPSQLRVLRRLDYPCVLGSAYAFDPHGVPTAIIVWIIKRAIDIGAIIVLHDSGGDRTRSVSALPAIIASAVSKNLTFVPVGELLRMSTH